MKTENELHFKEGDRMFYYPVGWIIINEIIDNDVFLTSELTKTHSFVNKDGAKKLISFTEYKLEGFSTERTCVFKKDDTVYVKNESCEWKLRYFSHYKDGRYYCFDRQLNSTETNDTYPWNFCEKENPLLNK